MQNHSVKFLQNLTWNTKGKTTPIEDELTINLKVHNERVH